MNQISRIEQVAIIRKASESGLQGYMPEEHIKLLTLPAAVGLISRLHDAGYVIAKS